MHKMFANLEQCSNIGYSQANVWVLKLDHRLKHVFRYLLELPTTYVKWWRNYPLSYADLSNVSKASGGNYNNSYLVCLDSLNEKKFFNSDKNQKAILKGKFF